MRQSADNALVIALFLSAFIVLISLASIGWFEADDTVAPTAAPVVAPIIYYQWFSHGSCEANGYGCVTIETMKECMDGNNVLSGDGSWVEMTGYQMTDTSRPNGCITYQSNSYSIALNSNSVPVQCSVNGGCACSCECGWYMGGTESTCPAN